MSWSSVQNSSGKRTDMCREPRAWGNQTAASSRRRSHWSPRMSSGNRRPKEFWPGGKESHSRGHASARLCRTPAIPDSLAAPGPGDRSPNDGAGVWPVSPASARLCQLRVPVAGWQVFTRLHASPVPPASKGPCFRLFNHRWCSDLSSGKGSWLPFPRWAANIPPPSGPRGHRRVIRAVANSICLGTRDPAWSPSPDLGGSLLLARRPALLDFLPAGCLYLLIFLISCGLVGDLVITPGSGTSCCLFPRWNLPASLSSLKCNTWGICVWYFLLFLQLKFYPFTECSKFCRDTWPEYSFHCWKPILL